MSTAYAKFTGIVGSGGGGSGTVTSVGLADGSTTPIFDISGSPVTTSGTITETLKTQSANKVFSGPTSGGAAQPTFRTMVLADTPNSATGGTSNLVSRDANGNTFANNFTSASNSTVSSGSPITLTANSARIQIITGTSAQTLKLPAANTLNLGTTFEVNNNSTDAVTVNDNSNTLVASVPSGGYIRVIATDVSSPAGSWDKHFLIPANGSYGTAGMVVTGTLSATAGGALTEATSSVLTITGGTNSQLGSGTTIQVKQASTSQSGYLSNTDWNTFNGKQASGNYITALTGDGSATGPGSVGLTLATVNSNVGSFGSSTAIPSFTVNGKGLITAASTNVVIAPAGTLTGTTLASNVVTSSLTSVGTITTGVWNGTTIAIANGGTGQITKQAAFDALSPNAAQGDITYFNGTNNVALVAGTSGQFLQTKGSSANPQWTSFSAPTIQKFTSTGTTTGYVFTVTSANATVGATYTNNSHTFTVQNTISSGTILFCSGSSAPQASGTLTKSTGSGDSTITFSAASATATYTTPSNPSPLYIRVKMVGGGGGGGGSGNSSPGTGTTGGVTYFGPNLLQANGGVGGAANGQNGGAGGTASTGSLTGLAFTGGAGQAPIGSAYNGTNYIGYGGSGGCSFFSGNGSGSNGAAGGAGTGAATNTGSGGGGAAMSVASGAEYGGAGGGAGGFVECLISGGNLASSFPYLVGAKGTGGTAGGSGTAGSDGADGIIYVEEFYQ